MLLGLMDSSHTHTIVCIDGRYPPTLFNTLIADALASPFLPSIVDVPPVYLFLWPLGLIAKSIKLLNSPKFASPCFNTVVYIAGFLFVVKAEAYKGKVPTTESY